MHIGVTMDRPFYVYILASKRNGTLYVGVTSDLVKRVWQHKNDDANRLGPRLRGNDK